MKTISNYEINDVTGGYSASDCVYTVGVDLNGNEYDALQIFGNISAAVHTEVGVLFVDCDGKTTTLNETQTMNCKATNYLSVMNKFEGSAANVGVICLT